MLATIPSATLLGVAGRLIRVEVHVSNGLPGFSIVGLPDASCREARDRVRAALLSSGHEWPLQRITVNLAPSGVPKSGAGLDLPIAIGVLVATGHLTADQVQGFGFVGELGLDGSVRPVRGVLSLIDTLADLRVVVPQGSPASIDAGPEVHPVGNLGSLVEALTGEAPWPIVDPPAPAEIASGGPDLVDVRGQAIARLALEVAAAGGHHLLLVGPPGAGKTMLARRLPGLLPDLDPVLAREATRIHSAAGEVIPSSGLFSRPPFRTPHHSLSTVGLVGGGSRSLRPGEISLAHGGVLLLDELGEFAPSSLDALRQPLEDGVIHVARAAGAASFPARFLLIGATNPCPCGGPTRPRATCRCRAADRARYVRRLSGPFLDRFDLRVEVRRPESCDLLGSEIPESSAQVASRVAAARERAAARGVVCNALLSAEQLATTMPLSPDASRMLESAVGSGQISARGLHRIWRVAATLADLAGLDAPIAEAQVALAMGMRAEIGQNEGVLL